MSLFGSFASWWSESSRPQPEDHRGPEPHVAPPPGLAIDADGWLVGDAVIRMPSARGGHSPKLSAGEPVCAVRHATATAWGTAGAIARSWRATVENHSAHVTIDVIVAAARDAEVARWRWRRLGWHAEADQLAAMAPGAAVIYQHRSLLTTSWHAYGALDDAAKTRTSGTINGEHLNAISIGIEATCVGQVARKLDGQWRGWRSGQGVGYGPAVPADQVQTIGGRSWHRYHPVLALEIELDAVLLARFPSLTGEVTITPSPYTARALKGELRALPVTRPAMQVGHIDVDPMRKADPYPTGSRRGGL
ncbi:MAG: hypothetical protein ACRCU1_18975 [Alsobacter sp.]